MALNFRLSYNTGFDYTDLLPHTDIKAIEGTEKILKYTFVDLTIPAYSGLTQAISMPLTDAQAKAPFIVTLQTTGKEAESAYRTIDQISASQTGFKIVRLGFMPTTPIKVRIRFEEAGVNG